MPKFVKLDPSEVLVGRGRAAREDRKPYLQALSEADAGRIELERGERPSTVKRLLSQAASDAGVRVRSGWETEKQQTLVWKKVGNK